MQDMDSLSLDELEGIMGGVGRAVASGKVTSSGEQLMSIACPNPKCGQVIKIDVSKNNHVCPICKKSFTIDG